MPATSHYSGPFARRREWSRDEWVVALDACPKDYQNYNAGSRDVREIAYLIGRTPAAVSRAFANIWAALTDGREGLANNSALCREVVAEYKDDSVRLHHDAHIVRGRLLRDSLAPRIEVTSTSPTGFLDQDLTRAAFEFSRETGLPRKLFAVYRHEGSVIEGTVLVSGLLGSIAGAFAQPLAERFVRWVEARLGPGGSQEELRIVRTRTWEALRGGRVAEVETTVIQRYLPGLPMASISARERHALASYLSAALGVGRVDSRHLGRPFERVTAKRKREIERRLGVRLVRLPQSTLREIDALMMAVDTRGFRKAVRALQQTQLDDFTTEGGPT